MTNDGEAMTLSDMPIATRSRLRVARALRYELNVVAQDAADVVASVGGWLFDRQMAGWAVTVALPDRRDERALRILGVKAVERAGVWPSTTYERIVMTVVAPDLFDVDGDVRSQLLTSMRRGDGDIAFWGSPAPSRFGQGLCATQYRLSAAAQAFKTHALAAVGNSDTAGGSVETLLVGGRQARFFNGDLAVIG
ncbi:hypothetical protein A5784_30470 [Mycobacterium sp. 852013-50091_SCH5140682]|nr:hypothetical protein A5784_30470 [Mycobacterium sp. 852013-50091_SCH5140682]